MTNNLLRKRLPLALITHQRNLDKKYMEDLVHYNTVNDGVSHVLKNVSNPMFKKPTDEPLNEQEMLIKKEMLVEDQEKKDDEKVILPRKISHYR